VPPGEGGGRRLAALRGLDPAELAELAADAALLDILRDELSASELAAAGAELGRFCGASGPGSLGLLAPATHPFRRYHTSRTNTAGANSSRPNTATPRKQGVMGADQDRAAPRTPSVKTAAVSLGHFSPTDSTFAGVPYRATGGRAGPSSGDAPRDDGTAGVRLGVTAEREGTRPAVTVYGAWGPRGQDGRRHVAGETGVQDLVAALLG
jgi:hypothetical protein